MAAAGRVAAVVAAVRRGTEIVKVVGDVVDVGVGVGVEMVAGLPQIAAALNDVEAVRDDTRLDKHLAVVVEVEAPRVAGAVGENFKDMLGRMITPDAGSDRCALAIRRSRFADLRMREHSVAAVEPAVRPPAKGI